MNLSHNKDLSNTNVVFKNLYKISNETRMNVNDLKSGLEEDYSNDVIQFKIMVSVSQAILRELLK